MSHDVADLRMQIARLQRAIEQRPYRFQTATNLIMLQIIDGQTVYNVGGTTYYGIKVASVIGGVGVAYDPDVSVTPGAFTATDGIGRAYIYTNGSQALVPVLVALDPTYPIPNALVQGDYVMTSGTVSIVVGGDPTNTITAYIPLFQ